jgi:hypothetical protein
MTEQCQKCNGDGTRLDAESREILRCDCEGEKARAQLIERLCAAVAVWLESEAHDERESNEFETLMRASRQATDQTGDGEHLAVLLDRALGEVK